MCSGNSLKRLVERLQVDEHIAFDMPLEDLETLNHGRCYSVRSALPKHYCYGNQIAS